MGSDPYRYFRVEAQELLDQLGKGTLELEKGGAAPHLMALLLRLAHTLKGAARVVKQGEIADQAHAIEDALAPFREGATAVPRASIDAMLKAVDEIASRMANLTPRPIATTIVPPDAGHAGSRAPTKGASPPQEGAITAVASNIDELDVLLDGLSEAGVRIDALRGGLKALEHSRQLARSLEEHAVSALANRFADDRFPLSTKSADLCDAIDAAEHQLSDSVEQLEREIAQSRDAAERLRLLPAQLMFVSLERTARDAGHSLGKRIAFASQGGEVRLDAQVFNIVQGALVQAVRNAVAHGIEPAAEREFAGKPADGHVWLEVRQRGQQAIFVCRDDGRGVDLGAVRRAAERTGLSAEDAQKLDSDQLLRLLMRGGLSTAGAVTQIAGRGIGLDVVREATDRLRATALIRTEEGRGTTLELTVPVTLAALDALIVEAGGCTLAIPMNAVKKTLRVGADDLAHSPQGDSIMMEGRVIPFAPLERALRCSNPVRQGARSWSAVVVEGANALAVVGVEHLRGTQNLVMRALPGMTPCHPMVAGASLNAAGHPQLVLDAQGLVEHICRGEATPAALPLERAPILVVDDSLTTRMLEQSILESAGYEVDLAMSGEEGLEKARRRRYALFLVDVEMPGMSGFTFIERLRQDAALRDIPAVLVTSRASPEDRRRGEAAGAQAHIAKGEFDQNVLLGKIRSLVLQ
jgi:two-component system chemotaxis sensor kinase CheA